MGVNGVIGWYVPRLDGRRSTRTSPTGRTSTSTPTCSRPPSRATRASSSPVTRPSSPTTRRWSRTSDSNFKVVYAGSEAALIKAVQQATDQKKPLLVYFYEPQWAVRRSRPPDPLVKIDLPADTPECAIRRRPWPATTRTTRSTRSSAPVRGDRRNGRRAHQELQLDQRRPDTMSELHRQPGHDPEEKAAEKWVTEHEATWSKWMPARMRHARPGPETGIGPELSGAPDAARP